MLPACVGRRQVLELPGDRLRCIRLRFHLAQECITAVKFDLQFAGKINNAVSIFNARHDCVVLGEKHSSIAAKRGATQHWHDKIRYVDGSIQRSRSSTH